MDNKNILIAEIKGLLGALEKESSNIRFQLASDNVYDTHLLDPIQQYLDAVTAKMTNPNEAKNEDELF